MISPTVLGDLHKGANRAATAAVELRTELSWRRFLGGLEASPVAWPATIRMAETVHPYQEAPPDVRAVLARGRGPALEGQIYPATSNKYGAVCAVVEGEKMGVNPAEFEILSWSSVRITDAPALGQG